MKKTLVALAVAAFASSASALTVYEADGSKVDFDGSIRLRLDQESKKKDDATTQRAHSNLHNDGTRFGVKMKHTISDDLFAFGRLEFRFDGGDTTADKFGTLYAKRAYVGFGSKQFGEVSFGRQVTIGDDIAQAGFDNAYGTFDTTLATDGKAVVRYDYKGIEGLQVGVDYRFADDRAKGEVKSPYPDPTDTTKTIYPIKSGYGLGATYNFKVAEGQSVTLASGYTRDNYKTDGNYKHHKDAWALGAKYAINALTLAVDYAGAFDKEGTSKDQFNFLRLGAKYQVTDAVGVYGNYGYGVVKEKDASDTTEKTKLHKFMLGADYKVHKNVFTYIEGGFAKVKETDYTSSVPATTKKTNKNIGVGLRVSW